MKIKLFFTAVLFAGVLSNCSKDVSFDQVTTQAEQIGLTKSVDSSDETKVKVKPFAQNMLGFLAKAMDFKGEYHLEPIFKSNSVPGDMPIMYVMNFEEGGWMIVAGHVREENQVLAYSKQGSFYLDEIDNSNVKFWFEMTRTQMERFEIEPPSESNRVASYHQIDPEQGYLWIRIPLDWEESTLSSFSTGHLLSTKWGQGSPWNIRTPHPNSPTFRYTGCVAVSFAQLLYYLKMSAGFTIGLYDVYGDFDFVDEGPGYYKIINYSRINYNLNSNKWSSMKISSNASGSAEYVAELMLDIAEHAQMKFFQNESGAGVSPSIFSWYGISCDRVGYNYDIVKASLNESMPVEIHCYPTDSDGHRNGGGHSWVIDGYNTDVFQIDRTYQWLRVPVEETVNYDFDDVLSDRDMERIHPNVSNGDIVHEYHTFDANYLIMNWGHDGSYDDGLYGILPSWSPGNGYNYNEEAMIIYNFRQ